MSESDPNPGSWHLLGIWAGIGLQSFGGGASTIFLIQRAFIERHHWLTIEEFSRLWNLCQVTPGINLIALTILIGKKLRGARGIAASLAGLLAPSATITCLLAALFVQIEQFPIVQAVLRGVIPATGGVMLLVGWNFVRPLLQSGLKTGVLRLLASVALVIASAVAVILFKLSVIVVVLGAVGLGILLFSQRPLPLPAEQGDEQ